MSSNATVSNSFTAGTTIVAAQVNANFSDLLTFLNVTGVHKYQASTVDAAAIAAGAVGSSELASASLIDPQLGLLPGILAATPFAINCTPLGAGGGEVLVDGQVLFFAISLPKAATVTGMGWRNVSSASDFVANNKNRVGLYTSDGVTLTLAASCADDATLWDYAAPSSVKKAFSATTALPAGVYYLAMLYNSSSEVTPPTVGAGQLSDNMSGWMSTPAVYTKTGCTDLPSTALISSLTAGSNSWPSAVLY